MRLPCPGFGGGLIAVDGTFILNKAYFKKNLYSITKNLIKYIMPF